MYPRLPQALTNADYGSTPEGNNLKMVDLAGFEPATSRM